MINEFSGEYRWLSNFWSCRVRYEGVVYPSVENAYQAAKCVDPADRVEFSRVTPAVAKKLGRKVELRPDWNEVKLDIMTNLVRQKFTNNEGLRTLLLATGDCMIIEGNTWGDTYWGVCRGKGDNHLGWIIMDIRTELRG